MLARNLFDSSHDESDAVHSRLQQRAAADAAVTVTGDGLNLAPVGRAASFSIQSRDIETADVNVKVTGQRVGHDKNLPVSRYNFNSFRSNFLFFFVSFAQVSTSAASPSRCRGRQRVLTSLSRRQQWASTPSTSR